MKRKRARVPNGKNGETVLLADDEAAVLAFAVRALAEGGYRVLAASDGEAALSLSERHQGPIHLLLTDIMMPVMNGKELADRLCALRPEIKVLFISGYPKEEMFPPETCKIEQVEMLPKPFTSDRLLLRVRRILDYATERG